MKFLQRKPVKGLVSAQEWTHYHPEIKFQSTADGERKIWRKKKDPAVYMGCIKKRKKSRGGGGFPLGLDCLQLRLSVLATKMRWRGTCTVLRWTFVLKKKKKACLLFNVKLDTVQKDNIMCLLGEASVTSQKSGEKTREWSC